MTSMKQTPSADIFYNKMKSANTMDETVINDGNVTKDESDGFDIQFDNSIQKDEQDAHQPIKITCFCDGNVWQLSQETI